MPIIMKIELVISLKAESINAAVNAIKSQLLVSYVDFFF